MEVLHASGPNAKVRVMRAAYHSTSGPGLPAASYMLHSSRRVISSGFNFLDSPTYSSKPLEISSTPLESSPDYNIETENYKVTEPDDTEISEPSKWRGTSNGSAIRMPSEESSSTDNASIIDLSHNNLNRKHSYDSENSDINLLKRGSARASPLLDVPATLSTLKYKSLLNGSNSTSDWNNRRKSYSFENTSPLNETIVHSNETLAMESSTDSGICKSSELVNECPEESENKRHYKSFEEWRRKNKENIIHDDQKCKYYKEHYNEIKNNNIALQSSGKVCITVPITLDDDENSGQPYDENDRRIKKVGFCKTELHFAAESGKVNIISTDEKPPPTNDFRKRRSAFVPINTKYEKPITLFSEKSNYSDTNSIMERDLSFRHFIENDENTAATKSILKNKIPKPKPYLLGENMVFGDFLSENTLDEISTTTGVSIINKQLQSKSDNGDDSNNKHSCVSNKSLNISQRAINNSPSNEDSSSFRRLSKMPLVNKSKTRQLRENELIYFGIDNHTKKTANVDIQSREKPLQADFIDAFESVRLVKQASNSAQTSDAESDDTPEYQNLPIKRNFAPVPTPRSRVRYKKPNESIVILKPIIEQHNDSVLQDSRRSRSRKQDIGGLPTIRSLSEPAKKRSDSGMTRHGELRSSVRKDTRRRYKENDDQNVPNIYRTTQEIKKERVPHLQTEKSRHLYENINKEYKQNLQFHTPYKFNDSDKQDSCLEKINKKTIKKSDTIQNKENSSGKLTRIQRTEKLSMHEYPKAHGTKKEPTNESSKNSTLEFHSSKQARMTSNNHLVQQKITEGKEHTIPSQDKSSPKRQETHRKTKSENNNNNTINTSNINQTRIMPSICLEKQENTENKKHSISPKGKSEGSSNANILIETPRISSTNKKGPYKNTKSSSLESRDSKLKIKSDKDFGTNSRKSSHKSEYVIKYDDKNGTVSSVSKVRGRHDKPRHKHVSNESKRDHSNDSKDKLKEKSGLRNATSRSSQACERKNNSKKRDR